MSLGDWLGVGIVDDGGWSLAGKSWMESFGFPSRLRLTGDDVVVRAAALTGRSAILTQFEMSAILGAPVSQPAQQYIRIHTHTHTHTHTRVSKNYHMYSSI